MDYVTFYHVTAAANVPSMKQGIDPDRSRGGHNMW